MLLGVNIDHVATLRNARGGVEPDVQQAAIIAEANGASSITAHLREDRRHIIDEDIYTLAREIKTKLNLEMAMADDIQQIALDIRPYAICLVPEKRNEVTTEGGLDVAGQLDKVTEFIAPLIQAGIIVSLFIDASIEQVEASVKTGAKFIELHTGSYAEAFGYEEEECEFLKLKSATEFAQKLGLKVNAGHGLNYENVHRMHEIDGLVELNIGHSIISKSIFTGLAEAVSKMNELIK
ncbi:MAG: pyridoxine 5'-phosphate synthase [Candidatus Gastranaerophilales bacterium]